MLRFKSVCRRILWLLPLAIILSFSQGAPGAWAENLTFSGPMKLKVIVKEVNEKGKFSTNHATLTGTFNLFVGPEGPVQNLNGNFAEFIDTVGVRVGIKQLVLLKTNVANSKIDQLRGMGLGEYIPSVDDKLFPPGPMYVDINSGKVVKDAAGNVKSIKLTMKMGGGTLTPDLSEYWSATASVNLTLAQ